MSDEAMCALRAEVEELTNQVTALKRELEQNENYIGRLRELLGSTRSERDELRNLTVAMARVIVRNADAEIGT